MLEGNTEALLLGRTPKDFSGTKSNVGLIYWIGKPRHENTMIHNVSMKW